MTNPANLCQLQGVVHGECWTRWRSPRQGVARGQVRFWLSVARELAGEGVDLLLCAIEPKDELELKHYEAEIAGGRTVHLVARATAMADTPAEERPCVVFVAESCGFGGAPAVDVHARPKFRAHGKVAAAGDDVELALEGGQT